MEALRGVLSPVKRENSFYRDGDDDAATTNILHNPGSVQTTSHLPSATSSSAAADKLSGTVSGTSSADKHGQQCVYCALSFKTKGELERHVKATHVIPTTSQKCNICDEVFPSAAVLAEHKLTHCKVNTSLIAVLYLLRNPPYSTVALILPISTVLSGVV